MKIKLREKARVDYGRWHSIFVWFGVYDNTLMICDHVWRRSTHLGWEYSAVRKFDDPTAPPP